MNSQFTDEHGNPILLPSRSPSSNPFWDATTRQELLVQRCVDTGRLIFPPRPRSPYGERRSPEWVQVSGQGKVWSFVIPYPPLTPQFEALRPYGVVIVALDEDKRVRMAGNLVAGPGQPINSVNPQTISIGEPVQAVFGPPLEDGIRLVLWQRGVGGAPE